MKILPVLLALCGVFSLNAQVDMSLFEGMTMRHIGPGTMSGRVTSIDVVRDQPEKLFVGTASGGLWYSESGGLTWTPIFDDQPTLSIGAVAINQGNPMEVWAGTGEGNPRNSHTSGGGIFRSRDGGKHWEACGLVETKTIHRIIVHATDHQTVYAGALGSAWGPHPERGVFRSKDGGANWEKILFANDSTGCADLVVDPTNPNKLIAAMWQFGRKPWTFESGGEGSGLYLTFDGGDTWIERTEEHGLPKGNLGRIGLAIAPSDPDIVYALIEAQGEHALYKSTDGGYNWNKVSQGDNVGNRPFYYADIRVHPTDPKEVWSLWSMVSRSDDGGKNFKVVIPYSGVHPDHHAFYIHPDNPDFMLNGNDGGLNISRDGGNHWEFVTNLPLGQFYHINHDMATPYRIYGGMQDNGSWVAPSMVFHGGGIRNEDWQEISFGDGFDVVPLPGDPRYAYSMWQEGNVMKVDLETGASQMIRPIHPEGEKLRFNWNAAIAADPFNPDGVYFGTQFVHHSTNRGAAWEIISPDLTNPDSLKLAASYSSGGLTPDVTGAENHHSILCIAPSAHEQDVIWVGTDDGNVQVTLNGGQVWDNVMTRMKDAPQGAWIPQIEASPHNAGEAFVVLNDYRRNAWEPFVFHTTDYGRKWTRLVDESDVAGHALCIVQDPVEPGLLFLGTARGLYVSFDYGSTWNHWTHDYPNVATRDLKIHPREHDLIIGTFGRAAYILDDIRPLRARAKQPDLADAELALISSVPGIKSAWSQPRGVRFPGDHHWSGENRAYGVGVSFFARTDGKGDSQTIGKPVETASGEKEAKVNAWAMTLDGDTLRHLEMDIDTTGVHRLWWSMDTNGPRFPSWQERKADALPNGGGLKVPAGSYRLLVEWKGNRDSIDVEVMNDPRLVAAPGARAEQEARYARWSQAVASADAGFERLKAAQSAMNRINEHLSVLDDSLKQDVKLLTDSLSKEITSLQQRFRLPKGTKGYHDESELLSTFIWQARSHVFTQYEMPSENGSHALDQLEERTSAIRKDINALFEGLWMEWREAVENLDAPLFEDFEPME